MFMACIILVTSRAALTALLIHQILYSSHSQSCIYNSDGYHCSLRYIQLADFSFWQIPPLSSGSAIEAASCSIRGNMDWTGWILSVYIFLYRPGDKRHLGCLAATYLSLLYRYNMDFQPSQFTILAELLQCNSLFMCQV